MRNNHPQLYHYNNPVYRADFLCFIAVDFFFFFHINFLQCAEESAKATSGMVAQVGRASYTAASVQKEPDAGAVAVLIWLQAVYEAVYL